jgi:16S rRNA (guanine(966)-N(2))-methyltransferase RsmD
MFAALGDVSEADVLDLYAGSGALGIEALSRGANAVVFVEQAAQSVAVLRRNLETLELETRGRVVRDDVVRALRRMSRNGCRFDLVLADPPYASGALPPLLQEVADAAILKPGGTLLVERGRKDPVEGVPGLELREHRAYGDTVISRFEASSPSGGVSDR